MKCNRWVALVGTLGEGGRDQIGEKNSIKHLLKTPFESNNTFDGYLLYDTLCVPGSLA